jgi:hypothetical protein
MRLKTLLALLLVVLAPIAVRSQTISTVAGGGSKNVPALSVGVGGPEGVIKDAATGDIYILDNFYSRIFKVDNATGTLTIFAGNGTAGFSGDGGDPKNAQLSGPSAFFRDAAGNFFIADSDNNVIREIPVASNTTRYGVSMPTAGFIYTIVGTGGPRGYGGDGGPALSAQLSVPDGVWVDATGNLFFGDRFNHIVRKVDPVTGIITTIAGVVPTGGVPNPGFSGDGGVATSAMLHDPWGVYGDANGNIFIADSSNSAIREVAGATPSPIGPATQVPGHIYTVAGTPSAVPSAGKGGDGGPAALAQLNTPHGVFFDAAGNLFISDYENHAIREVPATTTVTPAMTAGHIYTLVGTLGTKGKSADGTLATSAALAHPSNVFFDGANLFIANSDGDIVREVPAGTGTNYTVSMTAGDIYTIAGNGFLGFGGDGAVATNAELSQPFQHPGAPPQAIGIATDAAGNLFVADTDNDVIREVSGGNIQSVVGAPGFDAYLGDGGVAASGRIANPNGVFVDKAGNWFIADTVNHAIREVPKVSGTYYGIPMTGGFIYTIAGTGTAGFGNDMGAGNAAQLNTPNGVFVDGSFNVFIADTGNNAIREIPLADGTNYGINMLKGHIYTVAGTLNVTPGYNGEGRLNTGSLLKSPTGVFVDGFGNIFISDTSNAIIREVSADGGTSYGIPMTANNIYTVAGTVPTGSVPNPGFSGDTGLATSAKVNNPFAILVDPAGNIFISDTNNHIVREVAAVTAGGKTANHIYTVAGTPQVASFKGDGGLATAAELNTPQGLAASSGNLLVADSQNVRIRSIGPLLSGPAPAITLGPTVVDFTTPQPVNVASAALPVTLANNGTAALTITTISSANTDFLEADNCPKSPATLAAGSTCTINVMFSPTLRGTRTGSISVADSATGSPHNVALSGVGLQPTADLNPTSVTFATSQTVGTVSPAQPVLLTNNGNTPLAFTISLPGSDFVLVPATTNPCTSPLAKGASCNLSVEFTPTAPIKLAGTITLTDNAAGGSQTIALSGTGLPTPSTATLSSASIGFASQLVATSAVGSVTMSNNGNSALAITGIGITPGDFTLTPANPCGNSLAAGAKCTIGVTFTPTAFGSRTATVTITDNAGGVATPVQQTISVNGTGLSLALGAASGGSTTQTIKAGQTATYSLQLSTAGGAPTDVISVAVACTGAPSLATCSGPSTPITVVPGTPVPPFAITVKTTGSNAVAPGAQFEPKMQPPAAIRTLPLFLLALLSIAALLSFLQSPASRMRTLSVTMAACLVLLPMSAAMVLQGCGGGSSGGTPPVTTVAPSISTQPANQTVTAGQTASFTVAAAGTAPLTYQWQKNGTAISGATSASYTTPATVDADNGATFTAVVSNSAGNATSNAATMTVQFTPSATSTLTVTFTPTVNGKVQAAQTVPLTLVVQ